MKKVGIVSLGCDKNRVDTEIMLFHLQKGGYTITPNAKDADILIVNTCAFIKPAREESIGAIFEMAGLKYKGNKKLVVTGCLPQKYIDEIFDELPEVDGFLGTNDYATICEFLENLTSRKFKISPHNKLVEEGERVLTTAKHFAYLRVADGCDNFCTYCLIPKIRGRFRSRTIESVVAEARHLVENGTKELILVAQDLTKYGFDLYGQPQLVQLLKELKTIDKLVWIRLLYCYPESITDQLIDEIAENDKVAKYIDVPLQHCEDEILKLMGRKSTRNGIVQLFKKLRSKIPEIAIRSTFILGFPNESNQNFENLLRFLRSEQLANVGFFPFSCEDETPACKMKGQIEENTKQARVKKAAEIQSFSVHEQNKKQVGTVQNVVIDSLFSEAEGAFKYIARNQHQCPSIDGCVVVSSKQKLSIGEHYDVKILSFSNYDLMGESI